MTTQDSTVVTRRRIAGVLGLLGAGTVAAAVAPMAHGVSPFDAAAAPADHAGMAGMGDQTEVNAQTDAMTADEMDTMHEAGIKLFPAKTEGLGGQPLAFEMDGDTKVFKLVCESIKWEVTPGKLVDAWAYNGTVPGPEIRVTEGDKIRVLVTNKSLPESTAVHWHGLMVPNAMDGVPFITQPPIKLGETFTYEFPIREGNAGTHMYHSHLNSAEQVTKGLLGPFIVESKDPARKAMYDTEHTIVLNDGPIGGFSLNGKGFPATEPYVAKKGERILFRFMNEGLMIHPMHLHGMPMKVIAADGYLLPTPYMCDTLNIAPGQRYEAIVEATEVGTWAFHCHILSHAEAQTGMFGMVTALIVQE